MMLQSVQGIPLLWFIPVVALRHILMRPLGSLYKDRDSNPTCTPHTPLQAAIVLCLGWTARAETVYSGLIFALNLP
jgi:hypothetical protein